MSLLDFFQRQRWLWQNQPEKQLPEFLVGGLVALDQAEARFKTLEFYNVLHCNQQLEKELAKAKEQLEQQRKQLILVQNKLAEERKLQQELLTKPKWEKRARRALLRLTSILLDYPEQSHAAKCYEFQQLVNGWLTQLIREDEARAKLENPGAADA
jgi:hypothetical protein